MILLFRLPMNAQWACAESIAGGQSPWCLVRRTEEDAVRLADMVIILTSGARITDQAIAVDGGIFAH